ncbi:MFS transporter [Nitrospira sp. NS4]|uniref:MFS transporter n=1 Tax=Nitrospira sp. NS4 TaxID=3414498 RepID=UPI003C2D7BAB
MASIYIAFNVSSSMPRGSTSPARDSDRKDVRSAGHPDDAISGLGEPRRTVAIASVLAAMVLVVLDAAVANVALPTIARSLHVTAAMSVWVITAYQTALLMALLPCAALGESLGYRRVFTAGVALFTGASVLCALSPSLSWLVAARFLQGLGGAAVMALGVALLRVVVPHRQLGNAIGWNALAVALSSAAGPAIGAAVLSAANWHWLFVVNLPLGVLVLHATRALPDVGGTARRLDLFSVALNAGAFASLVIGTELLPTRPALAAVLLAAATLELVALVRREMPKEAPLIPLDLLRADSFRFSVIASACCFAGQTASMVALPFYLQHGLGQDTLMAGLYMTVWPLTVAIAASFAGRLADRVPTAWLGAAGGLCLATGLGAAALWPLKGDTLLLVPPTMLCGLGFGLFNVANNRNMFLSAPKDRSGAAGGMQGTARLFGQTAGAVIMALLFTLTSPDAAPQIGLGIGAMLTFVAGLVSTLKISPMSPR